MADAGQNHPAPHRDPTTWERLVESLDAASILVVIGAWIGPKLRSLIAVEDIWQETLWCSWRDREQHEWQNLAAWRVWLLSIARNRVRDAARANSRHKRGGGQAAAPFSMLSERGSISSMLPAGTTTPSRVAALHERAAAMEAALESLEPELQLVVRLRLFEEIPMRDIAEQLAIPLSTAKARLLRGVQKYRFRLRQLLGTDGTSSEGAP